MRYYFRSLPHKALALFLFALALFPIPVTAGSAPPEQGLMVAKLTPGTPPSPAESIFDMAHTRIKAVMAVQARHNRRLLAIPEVVGTAVGLTESGMPAVLVFTKHVPPLGVVPESLDGTPTVVHVTGEFFAMPSLPLAKRTRINPRDRLPSPVPIGVSTGNEGECSAGTIGARVKKGDGTAYALSNNHVYALENNAPIGSWVVQPGLYDTRRLFDPRNVLGTLSAFVPINFTGGNNTVDAAIARVNNDPSLRTLGNATPANGYGTPASAPVAASIGQAVQKYGRTTTLTKGTISGVNATVKVNYGASGTAVFVNQITVRSFRAFIKPGDSGSLLVTNNSSANPVGLLFAGNSSGTFSIANPIAEVLNSFGVTIDGKP